MAVRQGFLLIDLMLALSLFLVLVYAVLRLESTILLMHRGIMARTDMTRTLRKVIEEGRGLRRFDKKLPLLNIVIMPHGSMIQESDALCKLSLMGWIYE